MSVIQVIGDLQRDLRRITTAACREGTPDITGVVDGCNVVCKPFYEDYHGREIRREVWVDGYNFACEIERFSYSIFKDDTVSYWVWIDLPRSRANQVIRKAGLSADALMEEFYPTEGELRFNAYARTLEEVVALWKIWQPLYKPQA